MPRDIKKIDRFDGGLNNYADARDILDNELSVATNIMVDVYGQIRLIGSFSAVTSPDWNTIIATDSTLSTVNTGFGFFIFSADHDLSGANTPTTYFVIGGRNSDPDTVVSIYESDGTPYGSNPIEIDDTSSAPKLCFFVADGALRISDGTLSNSPTNYWFGYISRTHFSGIAPGGSADTYAAWYAKANTLAAPTRGISAENIHSFADDGTGTGTTLNSATANIFYTIFTGSGIQLDKGDYVAASATDSKAVIVSSRTDNDTIVTVDLGDADTWASDTAQVYPAAGAGFNIGFTLAGSGGSWGAGTYIFASTFIYDDSQESSLFFMDGRVTMSADDSINLYVNCVSPFDSRITGGRIYYKIQNSTDLWTLLADISLEKGIRKDLFGEYNAWSLNNYTGVGDAVTNVYIWSSILSYDDPNTVDTHKSLTGIIDPEKDITCFYETAVVANRMAYVGNVEINSTVHEDSIFKSFPNRFDTFTEERRLDVAVGDGESIVKLEVFGDRLLEFKQRTLYIINISQEVEFVESKFPFYGITLPCQSCSTPYGIVWINDRGCYLYDGTRINDLHLKDGLRKISVSSWDTEFLSTSGIAYDDNRKQIIAIDHLYTSSCDIYVYDFITASWTYGYDILDNHASSYYTNMVTDASGNILLYNVYDNEIYQWSNDSANHTTLSFRTKDIDFGYPGLRKDVYKVKISFKSAADSNVTVRYRINGGTTSYDFTAVAGATGSPAELQYSGNGWLTAILEPDTPSEANNIYSFQLLFDHVSGQTVTSAFKVNDISIIYRMKGLR